MQKSKLILRVLLIAFWVRMTAGYVAQMVLPALEPMLPYIALTFDIIIVMLGVLTIRRRRDFVILGLTLALTFTCTVVFNRLGAAFYLNGMRDFIGYLFVMPILNYFLDDNNLRDRFIATIDRHLYLFLIIQVPCVITQFIRYGAADPVGGSLGTMNSGLISTLIYLISFYLMQRRIDREHVWQSIFANKWLIILLFPTFLNETKVSFVFMFMYLVLLFPIDRKAFMRTVVAVPAFVLILYGGATAYVIATGGSEGDVFSIDYYMEGYLFNSDTDDVSRMAKWIIEEEIDTAVEGVNGDVPRLTKMLLLPELLETPRDWAVGQGVGHFKGGTISENSEFFRFNEWLLTGSIPYSFHILVQLGVIGILLVVAFFVVYIGIPPGKGYRRNHNLQLYVLGLLLILQLYQDTLRNAHLCIVLFYVILMSWQLPLSAESSSVSVREDAEL